MNKIFYLKALTAIFQQIKEPAMAMWNMAIGDEKTERTQKFEIHNKRAGRLRAPLVGRREKGTLVKSGSYQISVLEPPAIKLIVVNEAERLLQQQFGMTEYDSVDKAIKKQLADDLKEMRNIASRTKLWMLMRLLTTGICPLGEGDKGIKFDEDFAKDVLSGGQTFSNPDYDIVAFLEKKQEDIYKDTGITIDTIVVSPDVADAIRKNKAVIEDQKTVNSNLIQFSQRTEKLSDGMKLICYLPKLDLTIYSYIDWAKTPDEEEETQLLPAKHLIGFKKGGFIVRYGAQSLRPKNGESPKLFIKKEVVRKWSPDGSEDDELQYFSSPVIIPTDAKAHFCAQVIE